MIVADLERANGRVAAVERRNVRVLTLIPIQPHTCNLTCRLATGAASCRDRIGSEWERIRKPVRLATPVNLYDS